jgi:predicted glycosyltransferase
MNQPAVALPSQTERVRSPECGTPLKARALTSPQKKIWIDLENSPHVPFFKPIIEELEKSGFSVLLTARDCFQVCDLADCAGLRYKRIGRHYGKHTLAKLAGLGIRVAQLAPTILREKPILAISHGSRSLFLLASMLRIPTITLFDYEHAKWIKPIGAHWVIVPEVMPEAAVLKIGIQKEHILRYPGIKEDVYVPSFRPNSSIREQLDLHNDEIVVTIRPPASEAHYRNPESDNLLRAVFELLERTPDTKAVLLPRTPAQEAELRTQWPALFQSGRVVVPEHVVNGLDLIWFSDLVVSGGGTMNREAAALGVPVYSIFRGAACAVDRHLAQQGRLVLLESPADVTTRLKIEHRRRSGQPDVELRGTLQSVVDHIATVSRATC